MKWRKIDEEQVKEAINKPDKLEGTIKGRRNAFKTMEDRLLKVTYKAENDEILVVTTIAKGE